MRVSPQLSFKFLLLGAVLFTGVAAAADLPSERAKTEGFAVVRIVHNGGVPYRRLVLERADDGRDVSLMGPAASNRAEDSVTYAAWLDPGTYRFHSLYASWSGFVTTSQRLDLAALELPTFTVAAGELVDLGTWLQQSIGDGIALVPLNDAFGRGSNNERLDEAAGAFSNPPVRWDGAARWERGPSPDEFLDASKGAAMVIKSPRFDDEGNAYFASSLGQVLRRTPRGEWRNFDTGTLGTLGSLWIEGSNIYAGSEEHRLLQSSDGGATWASAEVPVDAPVTSIARLPNGDFVAVTEARRGSGTQLLRGPDFLALPSKPWTTLDTGPTPGYLRRHAEVAGPVAGRLIVWADPRSLHVYDIANDRWTTSRARTDLGDLYVNGLAGLVYSSGANPPAAVAAGVRFRDGLISADGGTSWQRTNLAGHNGFGFRDRLNGVAMSVSAHARETFVETTSDGGVNWRRVETPVPEFCVAAQYLPPTDELVCVTPTGRILSTRTGADWTLERQGF